MLINWVDKVSKTESPIGNWNGVFLPHIGDGVVELRRTFSKATHYAQVLIRIKPNDDVEISMNGKAVLSVQEVVEVSKVVIEGQARMALAGAYRG